MKSSRADFVLEDDAIISALENWLDSPEFVARPRSAHDIYEECKSALFGANLQTTSGPRSVKSFGKRLAVTREQLRRHLSRKCIQMNWRILKGVLVYEFTISKGA